MHKSSAYLESRIYSISTSVESLTGEGALRNYKMNENVVQCITIIELYNIHKFQRLARPSCFEFPLA
jgi:hypothetical protein